jgi:CheY-like chemotaxis protein
MSAGGACPERGGQTGEREQGVALIVEDDEDIARFLEKHLGSDGWDTAVAEDAFAGTQVGDP